VALLFLGFLCGFLVGYISIETFFEFDSEYSASCFVKLTMENIKALFRQVHAGNSTCPGTGKRSIYDWSNHQQTLARAEMRSLQRKGGTN
jgi:uncharacterized protein YhfF